VTAPRWLLPIRICFLARAAFYSAALPLWEGFGEWSHFAAIRRVALVMRAAGTRGLPDEVLWLRWAISAIGSLAIPLAFFSGLLSRPAVYRASIVSEPLLAALWAVYLAATLALPAVDCAAAKHQRSSA
jgi:hypothetical protein